MDAAAKTADTTSSEGDGPSASPAAEALGHFLAGAPQSAEAFQSGGGADVAATLDAFFARVARVEGESPLGQFTSRRAIGFKPLSLSQLRSHSRTALAKAVHDALDDYLSSYWQWL